MPPTPKRATPKKATPKKATPKKATPKKAVRESTHVPRPRPARTARAEAAIARAFARVRRVCLAQPGVYEKAAWSEPTFRVEGGKMFLMFADNHHDDGRVAIWCMATPEGRESLLALDADRFFVPPYVGPSGWVGARLEGDAPWDVIEAIVVEAAQLGRAKPKRGPTRASRG